MKTKILNILDYLNIKYKNYEHTPAFSCDDAKWFDIPWKRVKSLFLRNKKASKYCCNFSASTTIWTTLFSNKKHSKHW